VAPLSSSLPSSSMGVFHQMGAPDLLSPVAQEMHPVCTSGVMRCCSPRFFRGTLWFQGKMSMNSCKEVLSLDNLWLPCPLPNQGEPRGSLPIPRGTLWF